MQLITSILLLKSHQIAVLRTSLIGGILSNMHLMLGLGFLIGGLRYKEEKYNSTTSQIQGTLMLLAMTSLVIPTASRLLANTTASGILSQSRVTSVILLAVYISFFFFQFNTHNLLFMYELGEQEEEEAEEEAAVTPKLHSVTICLLLLTGTTLIGFHAQFLTDSLNGLMASAGLNSTFVGIVLLPIFSNDLTAIRAGWTNHMDLCIMATLGKCIQTALLIIPVIVFVAWGMGIDGMTLDFGGFEIAALFASTLYVNFLISNGRSNW